MAAARIVAIAVATHPAAGVESRSDQCGWRGGIWRSEVDVAVESALGASGCGFSAEASVVVSDSRGSEASSIILLCAFAVSIASESSGLVAAQKLRCTFARAFGEDVQRKPLENCSRLWL